MALVWLLHGIMLGLTMRRLVGFAHLRYSAGARRRVDILVSVMVNFFNAGRTSLLFLKVEDSDFILDSENSEARVFCA